MASLQVFLLDTNVISELMRVQPDPGVVAWLNARAADDLWICAVTVAEIQLGVALLPDGRKRERVARAVEAMLDEDFRDRCLPFDVRAASMYAMIVADRVASGRPISVEDAQIAAIARSSGLAVVTRNVRDFAQAGVEVVNPFG